jgi:hypothetical protein
MAREDQVLRMEMSPDPGQAAAWLAKKLQDAIQAKHPDEVVVLKGQKRRWRRKYHDSDLVKIVTANDQQVCKFCIDMVSHNPYRYGDAKKVLPHHPGCRCQIVSLKASDPGFLARPTFKKVGKYLQYAIANAAKARKRKGKKVSQRGATIKRLRKKKRRFVAPSGYRVLRRQQLKK